MQRKYKHQKIQNAVVFFSSFEVALFCCVSLPFWLCHSSSNVHDNENDEEPNRSLAGETITIINAQKRDTRAEYI